MAKTTNPDFDPKGDKMRIFNDGFNKEIQAAESILKNYDAAARNLAPDYEGALRALAAPEAYKSGSFDGLKNDQGFKDFCANLGVGSDAFNKGEGDDSVKKAASLFIAKQALEYKVAAWNTTSPKDPRDLKEAEEALKILASYEKRFKVVRDGQKQQNERIEFLRELRQNSELLNFFIEQPLDASRHIVQNVLSGVDASQPVGDFVKSFIENEKNFMGLIASSGKDTSKTMEKKVLSAADAARKNAYNLGRKQINERAQKRMADILDEMDAFEKKHTDKNTEEYKKGMASLEERLNTQAFIAHSTRDKWYNQLKDAVKKAVLDDFPKFVKEVWNPRDKAGIKEYGRRALEWIIGKVESAIQVVKEAKDVMSIGIKTFKANINQIVDAAVSGICRAGIGALSSGTKMLAVGSGGATGQTATEEQKRHEKHAMLEQEKAIAKRAVELSQGGWSGKLAVWEERRVGLESAVLGLGQKMASVGTTVLEAPGKLVKRVQEANKVKGVGNKLGKFFGRT